jgi:mannose-6-phosphate isomerase-like protein (cupin superfamily)
MSFGVRGVILGPGEGQTIQVPGHPFTYKARKEDTGGAYTLVEATLTGEGPPQHIHHAEEEAFYILEGEVNVQVGEQTVHGTVGSFILIPRGTVHTFWNAGSTPAKLLVIVSPPGIEQFLAEVIGDEEIDTATFIERAMALAHKYHMEIVGPPRG